jgi:hypothetical protein
MTTETLTGRQLDAAVAEAMGWTAIGQWTGDEAPTDDDWVGVPPKDWPGRETVTVYGQERTAVAFLLRFSSYSGFAPVLAWLEANRPTREQAGELAGLRNNVWGVSLSLDWDEHDRVWEATYSIPGEWAVIGRAPTLPEAACRLLVAWAAKREGGR